MAKLKIRDYQSADETSLIALFLEFGHYLQKLDENQMNLMVISDDYGQRCYRSMIKDFETKQGKILVVENEENSEVVGFAAAVILEVGIDDDELDCRPHRMGRVTELFISEKYRGLGFGTKLLTQLQDYFREQGCFKVNIGVFGPNKQAYQFYQKFGYQDCNVDLGKVLL